MIALIAAALAGGELSSTAQTLDRGTAVVRLPTGRSAIGLSDLTELWVVPLDLGIGGPRVGIERSSRGDPLQLSVRPSLGVKHTLHRLSLRVEGLATWTAGQHRLSAELAVDARLLRTTTFGDGRKERVAFDRVQSHALLTWDLEQRLRTRVRLPLRDRGDTLRWGSGSLGWVHTAGRVHLVAGVGMLVGRPTDAVTLGRYHWWFWLPHPEVDLAIRL